jgi:flagellar hook-length control protein FliK
MPQAIAMQVPVTAAATPTAAVALATTGSATGKTPVFAGLLSQLGRIALPSTPSAGLQAGAADANTPADAGQRAAQRAPPGRLLLNQAPSTSEPAHLANQAPPISEPAFPAAPPSALPSTSVPAFPATPLSVPTPDLPAVPLTVPAQPAPGSLPRQRLTVAGHSSSAREPAAAAALANDAGAAAGTAPAPTPLPAIPTPANTPEPPRQTPAHSRAEGPRLEGMAPKPGSAASEPSGNHIAPDPLASAGLTSTMAASPAWSSAPVAASATEAGASAVQSVLATTQSLASAGPVHLPSPADTVPAPQPDSGTAAPAQQVSAALVSLAHAPDGGQRMTLRLEPAELGLVEIRINRPADAPAQVDITVQRLETMTLLLRDQPQLQRALDQAGVPADGRTLTLHVAAPETAASTGSVNSGTASSADPGQNGGNGAGARSAGQGRAGDAADQDNDDTPTPLARWLRAGLDITA